jgi:drug/metabolite transporter (DMT)-like permease
MPAYTRLAAAFAAAPAPIRGAAWMLLAAVMFTCMNGTIRVLTEELPAAQVVFFRNLFGLMFMLPWLLRNGLSMLQSKNQWLHVGRAAIAYLSMLCWFSAVSLMPLAEATAVTFTGPIFSTIAAVLILGEVVRVRRWSAMAVGLAGTIVVLRPGFDAIGLPELLVLGNAVIGGVGTVMVKHLTRTESASAIVTFLTAYTTPLALIPALFVWVTPSWTAAAWVLVMSFVAVIAHYALTRAFAVADTSFVMAFDYARLPLVALMAWLAFGEAPDLWTWIGGAMIIGSVIYIAHREAVLARENARRATAAGAET